MDITTGHLDNLASLGSSVGLWFDVVVFHIICVIPKPQNTIVT